MASRVVARFSCGAASAVATKLAIAKYGVGSITYCDPGAEHSDNKRFLAESSRWFGQEVTVLRSDKYKNPMQVWKASKFIVSAQGAPCTGELKRAPTYAVTRPDDVLVFGYTAEEKDRADQFRAQNPEVTFLTPLIDAGLTKADCLAMLERAGIDLPAMYLLGFHNNNCIGCCKGGMGYWNRIRIFFPSVFYAVARLQRSLGRGSGFWRERATGERIMLDELDPNRGRHDAEPKIDCSLMCHMAETDLAGA